jgi:CubicO group peptidase (beta-lactamase class C family)
MGRRRPIVVVVALVVSMVVLVAPAGASASVHEPPPAVLRHIADSVRQVTNAPGAIVAVQIGHRPPRIVAAGSERRDGTGALRPDSAFLTASVSKAFTAATVLALVRDGKLALSDRVVKYVPGWDRRITVRMLLDHSSGVRSWGNKDDPDTAHADLVAGDLARRFTPAESLEPVRAAPLLARPGTRTHYSNANTILAGEVVAAVTGLSIGAAIDRFVVRPLHLTSTGYAPEGLEPRPKVSGVLYLDDARTVEIETAQYPMTSLLTLSGPSIGVVSDAPDLLAFARAFLRDRFPTASLARRAQQIDRGGAGLGIIGFTPHGYCIFDGCPPHSAFPRRGFAGNVEGGAVRVVYDPHLDAAVLIFANSSERGRLDPLALRTFRALQAD